MKSQANHDVFVKNSLANANDTVNPLIEVVDELDLGLIEPGLLDVPHCSVEGGSDQEDIPVGANRGFYHPGSIWPVV